MTARALAGGAPLDFVDAMRGIAILMVIAVHTAQRTPNLHGLLDTLTRYGQMGVQLFFVASALTLCLSHARRRAEPDALRAFYVRRFFRIAPLYYLAIPLYVAFDAALQLASGRTAITIAPDLPARALANLLFVHGFVPSANNTVVPGGWSIGTEMAFYAVFPALFALVQRTAGADVGRLCVAVLVATLANLGLQAVLPDSPTLSIGQNTFMYYNLVNQLPVFLVGFLAFGLLRNGAPPPPRAVSLALFAAFTAVALLLWHRQRPILFAVIPVVSAVSFLFLMQVLRTIRFEGGWLARVGQASYSMYVVHFLFAWGPVALIAERLAGRVQPDLLFFASYLGVCAATYGIASTLGRRVERWGIDLGARTLRALRSA